MHKYKCFLSQCFSTLLVYEVTKLINNVANVSFLFSSCVIQSLKTSLKHSPSPEALFSLPAKKKKRTQSRICSKVFTLIKLSQNLILEVHLEIDTYLKTKKKASKHFYFFLSLQELLPHTWETYAGTAISWKAVETNHTSNIIRIWSFP